MKDVIISQKAREEKMLLLESIADMTAPTGSAWVSSSIDLARRYN